MGSQHGFSLFGSVDSEQSVPRTAPLATPEQDMSLISSVENLSQNLQQQQSLDGIGNDVFQNDPEGPEVTPNDRPQGDPTPENPISFNVEITPPQSSGAAVPDGATSLPDVVPKISHRLLKHRPSLISAQMSSSLETDSSQADTPLFQYSGNTAFPFNPPVVFERKDSSTSSSGPNTPDTIEIRRFRHRMGFNKTTEPSISIPRLPCLPERSTYPVELKQGERLPQNWEARMDSYGRVFYIDHKNHTTTWQKPLNEPEGCQSPDSTSTILNTNEHPNRGKHHQERQQLDRRYQCIRKSIARN